MFKAMPNQLGREDRVSQGLICDLDGQVPKEPLLGLDGVALVVVVGEVEQLEAERGPQALDHLGVEPPDADGTVSQRQHVGPGAGHRNFYGLQ